MRDEQPNEFGCPEFRRLSGIDRRGFVRAGVLGMAGLSLADVLRAESMTGAKRENSVIILWMRGGPSQHETWDPKPEAPTEYRGAFGAMSTNDTGVSRRAAGAPPGGRTIMMALVTSL